MVMGRVRGVKLLSVGFRCRSCLLTLHLYTLAS